jgi:hypothetical protein
MKRFTVCSSLAALLAFAAFPAHATEAQGKSTGKMSGTDTPATLTGEVVDTGCYLGHGARGEKHVSCATKCINNGMPMGLLTADGTLYLITLDHENADPYNQLKTMAGKTVTVTGSISSRGGMKGIDVTAVKLAMAAK